MLSHFLFKRRIHSIIIIFSLVFAFFLACSFHLSLSLDDSSCSLFNNTSEWNISDEKVNNTEDEKTSVDDYSIWCLHMAHYMDHKHRLTPPPILRAPSVHSTRLHRLPYYYSQWKSSPLLPRATSPCEHSLMIRLLMIIERICRKHQISFMLGDGTLLGSWRHHDIIPWDGDLDVFILFDDRDRFLHAIQQMNATLAQYLTRFENTTDEYFKVYFKNTPSAGGMRWNFPFVDIYTYDKNDTHTWKVHDPKLKIENKYVYPLIMRPLGELWLPTPKDPSRFFEFDPYDECKAHGYDYRNETSSSVITRKCDELKDIYPFVERSNQSNTTEVLKINGTIIHTIIYN